MRHLKQWCESAALLTTIILFYTWLQAAIGDWQALLAVAGAPLAVLDGARGGHLAVRRVGRRPRGSPAEPVHRIPDAEAVPAVWISPAPSGFGIVVSGRHAPHVAVTVPAPRDERAHPYDGNVAVPPVTPAGAEPGTEVMVPSPPIGRSQHCVLFAVDIAQFTDAARDDEVQLAIREALYRLLIESFHGSGIPWGSCIHEDRGDGVVVVIPAHMPTIVVVDDLVEQIRMRLRRYNRLSSRVAQVRLRLAVHIGEIYRDRHGLAGKAVNHLFRMLDAQDLREALQASPSGVALIVSDYVYESVIHGGPDGVDPTAYCEVMVRVKQFKARAWLLEVPGPE